MCGGLGDSEFGRSFQKLGRKSPLVVAVQDANMDLVGQGEGHICEKSVHAAWTRRRVFLKAVKREWKSAMFLGCQTEVPNVGML